MEINSSKRAFYTKINTAFIKYQHVKSKTLEENISKLGFFVIHYSKDRYEHMIKSLEYIKTFQCLQWISIKI